MQLPHRPPPELAAAPFSRAEGLAVVGEGALRSEAYRSVVRGAHWLSDQEVTHARLIEAYRAVLPPDAVLAGWSAAWAHGLRWAPVGAPVEVVVPAAGRPRNRSDLVVRSDQLLPGEVVPSAFGPVTSMPRTAFDLARRPDPRAGAARRPPAGRGGRGRRRRPGDEGQTWLPRLGQAVAAVDALLREGRVPVSDVLELAARHPGTRGCRRAVQVLALADPRAESPRESELRVLLVQAGLPVPELQVEVRDSGLFVARLDMAWPEIKVGLEYDGAHHRERDQHSRDLTRHNALRMLGWLVLQVDADQFAAPERLLAAVRRARADRGAE